MIWSAEPEMAKVYLRKPPSLICMICEYCSLVYASYIQRGVP